MSSKNTLFNILKKAHANGFRCKSANTAYESFTVVEFDNTTEQFSLKLICPATTSIFHSSLSVLVNDANFMKAFFGEFSDCHVNLPTSRGNLLSYLSIEIENKVDTEVLQYNALPV